MVAAFVGGVVRTNVELVAIMGNLQNFGHGRGGSQNTGIVLPAETEEHRKATAAPFLQQSSRNRCFDKKGAFKEAQSKAALSERVLRETRNSDIRLKF